MTDNSFERNNRIYHQKHSSLSKKHPEILSSPYTPSETQSKPLPHPTTQQRKIFGFQIYVDSDILNQLDNIQIWFQKIVDITKVESIRFNNDLSIPDLGGHNIQIYDKDMQKKYDSCKTMLNDVYQIFKKLKNDHFSIIIFVPEGMVSLLIGTKGHQINKIMKQSHTTIVVNQPINKMTYRTVKIQGYHPNIALACKVIYQILQEKSSIAYSIEKQPSQLDYSKAKIKSKFIFSTSLVTYLSSKKKSLLKKVEQQTKCTLKFKQDEAHNDFYKKEEEICIFTGKLEDVQAMLVVIINLVHDYYCEDRKNVDYTLKMLIPSNYVTKLIGQKGYMIRDIIERSGGAQIKILSEKQVDRDARECIIAINGTRQNKIDATCLILQQIQCFKNGGPILQSGKSINQNLAQQFKNSIPLRLDDVQNVNSINSPTPLDLYRDKMIQQNNLNITMNVEITSLPIDSQTLTSPSKFCLTDLGQNISLSKNSNKRVSFDMQEQKNKELQIEGKQTKLGKQGKQTKQRQVKQIKESKKYQIDHPQYSRSRDKKQKKQRKQHRISKRDRSHSQSIQLRHEKQFVEIKLVVPKKLANDYTQLAYIQSLCNSEIKNIEQRVEGNNEAIICVRGLIKDNQQCIKLLQKRIARITSKESSG